MRFLPNDGAVFTSPSLYPCTTRGAPVLALALSVRTLNIDATTGEWELLRESSADHFWGEFFGLICGGISVAKFLFMSFDGFPLQDENLEGQESIFKDQA